MYHSTAYWAHYLPIQLDSDLLDTIGIFLRLTHDVIYWIDMIDSIIFMRIWSLERSV